MLLLLMQRKLREWLSGGAPPCQGGGRGFDPRLALYEKPNYLRVIRFFYVIGNFVSYDIKTLSYTMLHWSIVTHA